MRPDPRHAVTARDTLAALIAVGVFGVALLQAAGGPQSRPAAAAASAAGVTTSAGRPATAELPAVQHERTVVHAAEPPAARASVKPARATKRPTAPRRAAAPAHPAAARKPVHVRPFVPTGTGMWIYKWHDTMGGDPGAIVARAKRVGLSTLYLRTGSSWDGFTAHRTLPALLRATRNTGISVVAWDFPQLRHPGRDALRLAHAAWTDRGGSGTRVAAVAPDIETPAEGTFNAAWRVRTYLRVLRHHLPTGVTILSTVPWPSSYRLSDYPYGTVAARSDVLVPMAYWYNNSPGYVTERSIRYLERFHKPVAPVGQGYDGKLDVPSLAHNNLSREVPEFFRTAARAGAHAASIWSWQSARPATWNALRRAHHLFSPRR